MLRLEPKSTAGTRALQRATSLLLAPLLAAAIALGLSGTASALAQGPDAGQQPPAAETAAETGDEQLPEAATPPDLPALPEAEAVTARLAELDADEDLDAAARDALRATYEQTLSVLRKVSEQRALEGKFLRAESEAPKRVEGVEAELSAETVPTPIPEGKSLEELVRLSEEAQAGLEVARGRRDELVTEQDQRKTRRGELVDDVARVRGKTRSLTSQLSAAELSDTSSETDRANVGLERAELEALRAQEAALLAEERSYAARDELLRLRQERAVLVVQRREAAARDLESNVNESRREEVERARLEAERQVEEALERFSELGAAAEANQDFVDLRKDLSESLNAFRERLDLAQMSRDRVQTHYESTRRKVAVAGLTDEMGLLLRHELQGLLTTAQMRQMRSATRGDLADAQLRAILVEEASEATATLEAEVRAAADRAGVDGTNTELVEFSTNLFETRRNLLRSLRKEYDGYLEQLLVLDSVESVLQGELADYREFIEQRILWVRSIEGGWIPSATALFGALDALRGRGAEPGWPETWSLSREAFGERPGPVLWPLGAWMLLLLSRRRLRKLLRADAEAVGSFRTDNYGHTLRALGITALVVATWPLLLFALSNLLLLPESLTALGKATGLGLGNTAMTVAMFATLNEVERPAGLAGPHFRWPAASLAVGRAQLRWLVPLFVPLMFLHDVFKHGWEESWNDSAGRLALVLAMGILTVFLHIVFRPGGVLLDSYVREDREGLLSRTRYIWYAFFAGISASVALLALSGYYHTAIVFGGSLGESLRFIMLVVLIYSMTVRWMYVDRRRLGLEQARERVRAADDSGGDSEAAGVEALDEQSLDLPAVRAQTKQLLRSGLTFTLLFGFYGIWSPTIPGLQLLEQIEVWPRIRVLEELPTELGASSGSSATVAESWTAPADEPARGSGAGAETADKSVAATPLPTAPPPPSTVAPRRSASGKLPNHVPDPNAVTLYDLILAGLIGLISFLLTRNLPGVLEIVVLERLSIDPGTRYTVTTLLRYMIVLLGSAAVFSALQIGWSNLQWLVAALSFGLGFGLQEIFANFVSGLIILLERPVRLGDIVVVGGVQGRVTRLNMRATTITDWDRKELLVPNKQFITDTLVNHTLSDSVMRIVIDVHLVHGSDTKRARQVLERVARDSALVLDEPAPSAVFVQFGEHALKLQLRFFRESTADWAEVMNSTHEGIASAFHEAEIEFAFPRRELEVREGGFLGGLLSRRAEPAG